MPNDAAYNARHTGFTRCGGVLRLFPQPFVKHFEYTVATSTKNARQVLLLLLCPQLLPPLLLPKSLVLPPHVVEESEGVAV